LTIAPNAFLDAGSCAPTVTVAGNVSVGSGGTFILGCSPFLVIMPPVPPFPTLCPGITTSDSIGGNVTSDQPLALIFHATTINGNVSVLGGGGGVNCNADLTLSAALDSELGSLGPTPAYTDFENNAIHGGASFSGLQGCWFGIFRNQVWGSVSVTNNTFADADATEVATNTVRGNLTCQGNSPAAQVGDSGGLPNTVTGRKLGECASL